MHTNLQSIINVFEAGIREYQILPVKIANAMITHQIELKRQMEAKEINREDYVRCLRIKAQEVFSNFQKILNVSVAMVNGKGEVFSVRMNYSHSDVLEFQEKTRGAMLEVGALLLTFEKQFNIAWDGYKAEIQRILENK